MVEHIFELSNRYHLKLSNSGYVLYQLALNEKGVWKRGKGLTCKTFDAVVEMLILCELCDEDKTHWQIVVMS
ncbi:Uncharacterised protein [Canicola haemoglobinophilus]|uniref:Uncharacterized protein n=1 Tax=Canicola haemoglobinophilus TaxID=733 RepID=A0A377HR41_9PAST|nr:hypothetical protein [Canicola haemoglobinophilus]STO58841.1 Uncharacterised protein [Canicola haemoglobinophilus]